MCSYADDTTFHACDMDLDLAIEWFESNYMKLNQESLKSLSTVRTQACNDMG